LYNVWIMRRPEPESRSPVLRSITCEIAKQSRKADSDEVAPVPSAVKAVSLRNRREAEIKCRTSLIDHVVHVSTGNVATM
jgi:hypothetical protein